jgi:hypothetical protein
MLTPQACFGQVYVTKPPQDEVPVPARSTAADMAVMDRLAQRVVPRIFEDRVRFLRDEESLDQVVACLAAGRQPAGSASPDTP